MKSFTIEGKKIGPGYPVYIIAEAGVNHNGRLDLALKLIDAAAKAGADAVKFQTFKAEEVVTEHGQMAAYQVKNSGKKESQRAMLKKLELSDKHYPALIKRCKSRGITFLSTPHGGLSSVDALQKFKHPAYKIGSGDVTNRPLLEHVAKTKKPILLSTGMATLNEVQNAIKWIRSSGGTSVVALHCTSNYPTSKEETNLRAMVTMEEKLGVCVGFSDHTRSSQAAVIAATLGACVIEKHFTLNQNLKGPDHAASIEPAEFLEFVEKIRDTETYLGSAVKQPTKSEKKMAPQIRKSIVTAHSIRRGETITRAKLGFKRPGTGISPSHYRALIGKRVLKNLPADYLIRPSDYA